MSKTIDRDLKLNVLLGVLYQAASVITNFIVKQAIRYQLGPDYLGLQTVYGNFCDLLIFAFAGVGIAMIFRLYAPIEQKNYALAAAIFKYFDDLYRKFTLIAIAGGAVLTGLVLWSVDINLSVLRIVAGYYLYLAGVLVYNRYIHYNFFLMANQKKYIACLIFIAGDLTGLALELFALYATHDYIWFLLCILIKNALADAVFVVYTRRHYPYISEPARTLTSAEKRESVGDVKNMVITRVGNLLLYSTDSILISGLISTATAGLYSNYYFVSAGITNTVAAFFESIMSKIGQTIVRESPEDQFRLYLKSCLINIGITLAAVNAFYFLAQDFITLWMGSDLVLPEAVVVIAAANLYMGCARMTANTFRQSAGLFARVSFVILFRGIFNLALSVVLGLRLGLAGILIATTISDVTTVYWYEPLTVFRYYNKSFLIEIGYQALGLASVLLCVLITGRIASNLKATGWLMLVAKGLIIELPAAAVFAIVAAISCAAFKIKREKTK